MFGPGSSNSVIPKALRTFKLHRVSPWTVMKSDMIICFWS